MMIDTEIFKAELERREEHWRQTNNDPAGIATAVMVALAETRAAIEACESPCACPKREARRWWLVVTNGGCYSVFKTEKGAQNWIGELGGLKAEIVEVLEVLK